MQMHLHAIPEINDQNLTDAQISARLAERLDLMDEFRDDAFDACNCTHCAGNLMGAFAVGLQPFLKKAASGSDEQLWIATISTEDSDSPTGLRPVMSAVDPNWMRAVGRVVLHLLTEHPEIQVMRVTEVH